MKVRLGFVSNSSSSSFTLAYRATSPSKDRIKEVFAVPKGHPLTGLVDEIGDTILKCIDETYTSVEGYAEQCGRDAMDLDADIVKLLKKGFVVSTGSFSSEEMGIEAGLSAMPVEHRDKDFVFLSEGGY